MKKLLKFFKRKVKYDRSKIIHMDEFHAWAFFHARYLAGNFLVTEKELLEKRIHLDDYHEIVTVTKTGELMLCYWRYGLIKATEDFYMIVAHDIDLRIILK